MKAKINNVIHVIIINNKDCKKSIIIGIFNNISTITNNIDITRFIKACSY